MNLSSCRHQREKGLQKTESAWKNVSPPGPSELKSCTGCWWAWVLLSTGSSSQNTSLCPPFTNEWVHQDSLHKPMPALLLHCNSMGCYRLSFTARSAYFSVVPSPVAFMFCIIIPWLLAWQSICSPCFHCPNKHLPPIINGLNAMCHNMRT